MRTDDEVQNESLGGLNTLLDIMRADQNEALANDRWTETSQIQQAIMCLLEATSGDEPESMSIRVASTIRGVFARLYRWNRDRGLDEPAEQCRTYVENMTSSLM